MNSNKSLNSKQKSLTILHKKITKTKHKTKNKKHMIKQCFKKVLTKKIEVSLTLKTAKQFSSIPHNWIELSLPQAILQNAFKTRIMSFNLLADCNIRDDLYYNVNPKHLQWNYREPLLIE